MHPAIKACLGLLLLGPGVAGAGPLGAGGDPGFPVGVGAGAGGAIGSGLELIFGGVQRIDLEGEALLGSDITVLRTSGSYEQQRGTFTGGVTIGYTEIEIDYTPGAVTFPAERGESNREAQVDLGWKAWENFELTGFGRTYEGFTDYRSVWIAEFYEQSFGFVPGYRDADPGGWALGAGAGWDVVPGATRLGVNLGYGEDEVVEGWSFGAGGLEASRGRLETVSGAVVWEQAVNGWLKTQNSVQAQEITARDPRVQMQTSWAAAIGPDWTLRVNAGATREQPNFEAYYAGAALDCEFRPGWHVSLHGRYYEDTGEIESSGFSTAAPGLQSYELGTSLLYDRGDLAVRLYGGFYNADYEPLDPTNVIFGSLYRDRDWWVTRLAVSYSF